MNDFLDKIEACVPSLRRYAYGLLRNSQDADDLVQDTLERALNKSDLWKPTGSLQAWLFKILLNIYRNNLRKNKRQAQTISIDTMENEPSYAPNQIGSITLQETAVALNQLPADQREALLLVVLEGLSYAEAADILGIPIGTLMSRIGRAREKLREIQAGKNILHLRSVK